MLQLLAPSIKSYGIAFPSNSLGIFSGNHTNGEKDLIQMLPDIILMLCFKFKPLFFLLFGKQLRPGKRKVLLGNALKT